MLALNPGSSRTADKENEPTATPSTAAVKRAQSRLASKALTPRVPLAPKVAPFRFGSGEAVLESLCSAGEVKRRHRLLAGVITGDKEYSKEPGPWWDLLAFDFALVERCTATEQRLKVAKIILPEFRIFNESVGSSRSTRTQAAYRQTWAAYAAFRTRAQGPQTGLQVYRAIAKEGLCSGMTSVIAAHAILEATAPNGSGLQEAARLLHGQARSDSAVADAHAHIEAHAGPGHWRTAQLDVVAENTTATMGNQTGTATMTTASTSTATSTSNNLTAASSSAAATEVSITPSTPSHLGSGMHPSFEEAAAAAAQLTGTRVDAGGRLSGLGLKPPSGSGSAEQTPQHAAPQPRAKSSTIRRLGALRSTKLSGGARRVQTGSMSPAESAEAAAAKQEGPSTSNKESPLHQYRDSVPADENVAPVPANPTPSSAPLSRAGEEDYGQAPAHPASARSVPQSYQQPHASALPASQPTYEPAPQHQQYAQPHHMAHPSQQQHQQQLQHQQHQQHQHQQHRPVHQGTGGYSHQGYPHHGGASQSGQQQYYGSAVEGPATRQPTFGDLLAATNLPLCSYARDVLNNPESTDDEKAFALTAQFAGGEVFFVNKSPYVSLGQIGKGGSSKVYKVMDKKKRLFALKRVNLESADSATFSMYENEASLLKQLDKSPHVVRLVEGAISRKVGRKRIELVLELGDADLAALLSNARKNGGLSENYIRLYWQQMLEAVRAVHNMRVVHGDLKPANFVSVAGRLKLIDFGIAKAIQGDTTNISRDTQIGTLNYISPEALIDTNANAEPTSPGGTKRAPKMKLGRASDVWSLGCILYVMVHGKPPFGHLSLIQKIQALTDARHPINFPPEPIALVNSVLRSCLVREAKGRATIPDLLAHPFLRPTVALVKMQQQMKSSREA